MSPLATRLRVEALETRRVLSTFTVTNTADSGDGSLRQAILDADNDSGPNTILFALPAHDHTITPTSPLPDITTPTTLDGTTQAGRRVELLGSGGDGLRFIQVDGGVDGLTISGFTRGIYDRASRNLSMTDDKITGNQTGVYMQENDAATVTDCNISGNGVGLDFYWAGAGNKNVIGNHFTGNGIQFEPYGSGGYGMIEGNRFTGGGIYLQTRGTIQGNIFQGSGIVVNAGGSVVQDNRFVGGGIDVEYGGVQVLRNLVQGSPGNGITFGDRFEHSNEVAIGNTVIGSGGDGIYLVGSNCTIQDNQILYSQGNGVEMVSVNGSGAGDAITGNTITGSGHDGVRVANSGGASILQNSITDSGYLGIELVGNSNDSQVPPVLNSAVLTNGRLTISGTLTSMPNTTFTLEFFANDSLDSSGNGEGQTWLGDATVTTDANGYADFTATVPAGSGNIITATATNPDIFGGGTSEFSAWIPVTADPRWHKSDTE
jgi:parallel beta-helix repeat protein